VLKVLVDSDDLERIVFATAVIKNIERQLQAREVDPFVAPHLQYKDAHDRLVQAMNHAKRTQADTKIRWDEPLSDKEMRQLEALDAAIGLDYGGDYLVSTTTPTENEHYTALAAKGCIEIGTMVGGVLWSGSDRPILQRQTRWAIRITKRGRDMLNELDGRAGL
jgi:hypothetical protein